MIDSKKNDLPVFINESPALLVFTENNWDFPLVYYDVHNNGEFVKLLDKRKELVFKKGDKTDALLEDMEKMFGEL